MPDERDTLDELDAAPEVTVEQPPRPKTAKEREEEQARLLAELEEERRQQREKKKREKELEERRYKRKLISPGVVLTICLISAVTMFLMHFENDRMLKCLLVILIISWIVGSLVQYMFERFAKQNDEAVSDEGEVINKGSVNDEEVDRNAHG